MALAYPLVDSNVDSQMLEKRSWFCMRLDWFISVTPEMPLAF